MLQEERPRNLADARAKRVAVAPTTPALIDRGIYCPQRQFQRQRGEMSAPTEDKDTIVPPLMPLLDAGRCLPYCTASKVDLVVSYWQSWSKPEPHPK